MKVCAISLNEVSLSSADNRDADGVDSIDRKWIVETQNVAMRYEMVEKCRKVRRLGVYASAIKTDRRDVELT